MDRRTEKALQDLVEEQEDDLLEDLLDELSRPRRKTRRARFSGSSSISDTPSIAGSEELESLLDQLIEENPTAASRRAASAPITTAQDDDDDFMSVSDEYDDYDGTNDRGVMDDVVGPGDMPARIMDSDELDQLLSRVQVNSDEDCSDDSDSRHDESTTRRLADSTYTREGLTWSLDELAPPAHPSCRGCGLAMDGLSAIRCTTCNPGGAVLCAACDLSIHGVCAKFHDRQHFLQGYSEPLGPCQFLAAAGHDTQLEVTDKRLAFDVKPEGPCKCGASGCWVACGLQDMDTNLIVYSLLGRHSFARARFRCSACGLQKAQGPRELRKAGLVAANNTPQASAYVHMDVLGLARKIRFRLPGSSMSGICKVLGDLSTEHAGEGNVDQKAITGAYRRYRLVDRMTDLACGRNYDDCPTCMLGDCAVHVDGNSKLYTFTRSKDTQRATSCYEDLAGNSNIVIPDRLVKEADDMLAGRKGLYQAAAAPRPEPPQQQQWQQPERSPLLPEGQQPAMEQQQQQQQQQQQVDTIAAAQNVNPKTCGAASFKKAGDKPHRFRGLATSGCMLSVCQHLLVMGVLNMTRGETYSLVYAMLVLSTIPKRSPVSIFGDLMCKWGTYCKDAIRHRWALPAHVAPNIPRVDPERFAAIKLMVSGVHVLTHSWPCRVLFGPSWTHGAGIDNGETVELVNAYMSRTGNSMKHMSGPGKEEFLEETCWDFNGAKIMGMASYLLHRYRHAVQLGRCARDDWQQCEQQLRTLYPGIDTRAHSMDEMTESVRAAARSKLRATAPSGDISKQCFYLSQAVTNLRFIKQHLLMVDDIDKLLMDHVTGPGLQDVVAAVTARLPVLEEQLRRARRQASVLGDASSSSELQRVCRLMESSVTELEQHISSLCAPQQQQQQQQQQQHPPAAATAAATSIKKLAGELRDKLCAFTSSMSPSEQRELEQLTRAELVEHLIESLQSDIEGQMASMFKWQAAIKSHADSSKQRAKLRRKLDEGDLQLQKMVDNYNKLVCSLRTKRLPTVDLDTVKRGEVPWQFDDEGAVSPMGVPLKERLRVCEKWQWLQRTNEGKQQVLQGMTSYVHYYQALEAELQAASTAADEQRGMLAARQMGLAFCRRQLEAAADFSAATGGLFVMPQPGAGVHVAEVQRRTPLLRLLQL